ncbi:MAG: zf-HC2 domain-containing protein [Mycobacteriales bacterium]
MSQIAHLSTDAVVSYVDRELPLPASARAAEHVASCPECWAAVDRVRADKQTLGGTFAPDLPDDLLLKLGTIPTGIPSCALDRIGRGIATTDPSGTAASAVAGVRMRRGFAGAIVGVAAGMIAFAGIAASSQSGSSLPGDPSPPSSSPTAGAGSTSVDADLLAAVAAGDRRPAPAVRTVTVSLLRASIG